MECSIYRSNKKSDTYLYVEKPGEFDRVPDNLLNMLGRLEFVMKLNLEQCDKLAQVHPQQVMQALSEQGYFLQLPPRAYLSGSA